MMRDRRACLFVLVVLPALATAVEAGQPPSGATCPVSITAEPFARPSSPPGNRFWYGSEDLAVLLNTDGAWRGMGSRHHYRDKLFWWRQGFDGRVEQKPALKVTGRRLDGEAAPFVLSRATNAYHADLGGWAMLVGVEFPRSGCWELTGEYGGKALSFVVSVGP